VPSVTTVLAVIGKPALISWAANMERELVLRAAGDAYEAIGTAGVSRTSFDAHVLTELTNTRGHQRQKETASAIGTLVHARIEWELRSKLAGKKLPKEPKIPEQQVDPKTREITVHPALVAYEAYTAWRKDVNFKPRAIEQRVWSRKYGYAGTMDVEGLVRDVPTLLDWKSSKAIYDEALLQNAAYRQAWIEMGHGAAPLHGLIVKLPKNPDDPGFETRDVPWEMQDELFVVFRAARHLWVWQRKMYERWKEANGR